MINFYKRSPILLVFLFIASAHMFGQISYGGSPPSFKVGTMDVSTENVPVDFNKDVLKRKDAAVRDATGTPPFVAKAIAVDFNMENSGQWDELSNGQKIWRLKLKADGALAILLSYKEFYIPDGASLYIYNAEKTQVLGAYKKNSNKKGGIFSTEMVAGSEVILEYVAAKENDDIPRISIDQLGYAFNHVQVEYLVPNSKPDNKLKIGESGNCMVNINCSEGDDWQTEKKGVAKMLMYNTNGSGGAGWYFCTGTLVNNTAEDLTPYFLSAYHCYDGAISEDLPKWQFIFHYEAPECENANPIQTHTMVGCYFRAGIPITYGSDGLLLELSEDIPDDWNVYYNGWDRRDEVVEGTGVGIHHPKGDLKKISTFISYESNTWPGASGELPGATDAHWVFAFAQTANGFGVTEGGSSGSPMFSSEHLVVGTLTGGNSSCTYTQGANYYGKLWFHWDQYGDSTDTQMKTWLDPLNLGVTTLDGTDLNPSTPRISSNSKNITFADATAIGVPTKAEIVVVKGHNLTDAITVTTNAPYEVSTDSINWNTNINIASEGDTIYVRYTPPTPGTHTGKITLSNPLASNFTIDLIGLSCSEIGLEQNKLPNANIDQPYNVTLTAKGGTAPYTYTVSNGSLPYGLTLSSDGKISGTPNESGITHFSITLTDAYGCSGTVEYGLYTICQIVNIFPYNEDFESPENSACWGQEYVTGNINWFFQNGGGVGKDRKPTAAHSGNYNAIMRSDSYAGYTTKLVTPHFDLTDLTNPELSFWHAQPIWISDQDVLNIYYKTSALSEWVLLSSFTSNIPNWQESKIVLPNPSSEYFIAFEAISMYGYGIVIDDINIQSGESGISENNLDAINVIYTNPFGDELNVKWTSTIDKISIYTISGQQIFMASDLAKQSHLNINTGNWDKGVYVLNLQSGTTFKTVKLIKK